MPDPDQPGSILTASGPTPPLWTFGSLGLVSGVAALTLVLIGSPSWIVLGAALVIWSLSGWAIYFRPRPRTAAIAKLGSLLLLSAAAAALAVLSGLYLRVLGPSWIL